jgi:hypothetical protein
VAELGAALFAYGSELDVVAVVKRQSHDRRLSDKQRSDNLLRLIEAAGLAARELKTPINSRSYQDRAAVAAATRRSEASESQADHAAASGSDGAPQTPLRYPTLPAPEKVTSNDRSDGLEPADGITQHVDGRAHAETPTRRPTQASTARSSVSAGPGSAHHMPHSPGLAARSAARQPSSADRRSSGEKAFNVQQHSPAGPAGAARESWSIAMWWKQLTRGTRRALVALALAAALIAVGGLAVAEGGGGGGVAAAAADMYGADSAACEDLGPSPGESVISGDIYGCLLSGGYHDGEKRCLASQGGSWADVTATLSFAGNYSGEQPFSCAQ